MEPKNAIDKLAELVAKLPEELRSDWDGTNHYEMSGNKTRYNWWLDVAEVFQDEEEPSTTVVGKRLGLIMDIAVAAQKAMPEIEAYVSRYRS